MLYLGETLAAMSDDQRNLNGKANSDKIEMREQNKRRSLSLSTNNNLAANNMPASSASAQRMQKIR